MRKRRVRSASFQPIQCTECGKLFKPKRGNVKRCSSACRSLYTRRYSFERNRKFINDRKGKKVEVICRHCGALFTPKSQRHSFCTKECSQIFTKIQTKRVNKIIFNTVFLRPVKNSDITRSELAAEMLLYKQKGGKIMVLPTLPGPDPPEVHVNEHIEKISKWKDTWSDTVYEEAEKLDDDE